MTAAHGKLFNELFDKRIASDYDDVPPMPPEQVTESVDGAVSFVDAIAAIVEEKLEK